MTMMHDPAQGGMPSAVAGLLDVLRQGLANGRPELRATALYPLASPGLRAAMLANPRLGDRINERLASRNGWGLPTDISPFDAAENVIHLLTQGASACQLGIGLAWHGNTLSHVLMKGGARQLDGVDPVLLRRALALRHPDAPVATSLPSMDQVDRDGALCLLAWASRLPDRIAPTVTALLVRDPDLLALSPLGPAEGGVAAEVAGQWLTVDQEVRT